MRLRTAKTVTTAALDATTSLYVRTLSGDGTDTCARVDVSRIALPDAVTAGAGELLDASALHRSQLRTRRSDVVVHEFAVTTSLFASFRHLPPTMACARGYHRARRTSPGIRAMRRRRAATR